MIGLRYPKPRYLLLILLSFSIGIGANAWAADGRILSWVGDVKVNGQPVTSETPLNRGDKIVTGSNSSVRIVLADNSVLDIKPSTEIDLTDFIYDESDHSQDVQEIGLIEGTLRFISGLIGQNDPKKISIRAGSSTIGVRGSFITISFDRVIVIADSSIGELTLIFDNGASCTAVYGQGCSGNTLTQETTVVPDPIPDSVNDVARLIAESDPENPEDVAKIQAAIVDMEGGGTDQALLIAVLSNNREALNISPEVVTQTIVNIVVVNPAAAYGAVLMGSVVDPSLTDSISEATSEVASPEVQESINDAIDTADGLLESFEARADPVDAGESAEAEEETEETEETQETEQTQQSEDTADPAQTPEPTTSTESTGEALPPVAPPPVGSGE